MSAIASFAPVAYWTFGSGPAKRPVLETAAVEFGDLTLELPATGSIDAVNVVDVGSPISGRIKAIYADFNDHVKAGQLLAEIEDELYRGAYLQAEADVAAARAAVEVAEANLKLARDDQVRATAYAERAEALYKDKRLYYERNQKLINEGVVDKATFEKVQAAWETARAEAASTRAAAESAASSVKGAQANIGQARATAEQRVARTSLAKRNLDYCRITSPVNGVIVSRNADVGQTLAARLQAPSLFHIAEDLSHMYVYTKMDSSDVAKVRPGMRATFTVNAFPGEVFEGELIQVRINPNAPAPVSRASSGNQFQRTISSGVTSGSVSASETTGSGAAGTSPAGGSPAGGGSSSAGASGGARSNTAGIQLQNTTNSASAAPPDATRNTVVVYDALIEFRNPDEKLLPGMTAYVTIPVDSVKATLKVPNAALRFSPDIPKDQKEKLLDEAGIRDGEPVVWVVTGKKNYRPVRVKPALTDFVYTAVQSEELKPGMQVATRLTEVKQAT